MKVGLVVNPWAGVGGAVALKGSDGSKVRAKALELGAIPRASEKSAIMVETCLANLENSNAISWFTGTGDLGNTILSKFVSQITVNPLQVPKQTEAEDTRKLVEWFVSENVDLIVFAGGDGTARDVCSVVQSTVPVLGVPAGVKIHSAVFAVTPHAAGEVLAGLVDGRLTELRVEEVRDIDEAAFRENKVKSRYYGEMKVPVAGEFMQHVKVGGIESESLVLSDIADWLEETMEPDVCYWVGSGKSLATLMEHLQLDNTLLGIDAVYNGQVIRSDCREKDLLELMGNYRCKAILSIIGGQGHIFGRGNAQFSPQVLTQLKKADVIIVGSKAKIKSLEGRPLLVDTSNPVLDKQWAGLIDVLTGYNDTIIYPVAAL